MSLGTNIQVYRKKKELTQEGLADLMGVSRQTISKWESDTAYPETDKLITLSEMFGCTVDALIKGNAEEDYVADTAGYDKETNSFTKSVCAGTATVLFGLSTMLFMFGLFGIPEENDTTFMSGVAIAVFMLFAAIGAAIFIVGGIRYGNFVKENPYITPFYKAEEITGYKRKFPVYIAVATVIVFVGVITLVVGVTILPETDAFKEQFDTMFVSLFMLFITVAAPIYAYAGIQYGKYDIQTYNKAHNKTTSKNKKLSDTVCGIIMIVATGVFLTMGFIWDLWKISWVAYPIGGLLCGIVSMIFEAKDDKE